MDKNNLQLKSRVHQLERLIEIGRKLSTTYDLETLLQTIIEVASELIHCQETSILLYNKNRNTLEFAAVPWFHKKSLKLVSVPLENSVAGEVFNTNKPIFIKENNGDKKIYRPVDDLLGFETKTMLVLPLKIKEKTIGVLSAINKLNEAQFDDSDLEILEILASQAAIAIQNVQFLANSQKAYDDLAEFDQVKSDFVAITSHELRTPLGLILGNATYLQTIISPDLKPQLDVIYRSSVQLKGIVEDLSKVNDSQTGKEKLIRKRFDICKVLTKVTQRYQKQIATKKLNLLVEIPKTPIIFWGDKSKIIVAINHLVKNAIMFSMSNDSIIVRAEKLPGFVKIEVEDTGIGIPKKELKKIFNRFYQIENHMTRNQGGMGLGLAVTKMMVEMHNGRLGVHSEEGTGSVFQIMLPMPERKDD
jgi:signal transduction histidine kinase